MPVINIKSLPVSENIDLSELLKNLCTKFADRLGYNPRHVWAYWETIEPGNYAVGSETSDKVTENSHSPIVRILAFQGSSNEKIKLMLEAAAEIISNELKIDIGNVFIEYAEGLSGKIFDGGSVVQAK
jgi:phenylpyruvate tautomerase PptA (4-oxalocrotonate tautomerase family)